MLVTSKCWWLYIGEFLLVTSFGCWLDSTLVEKDKGCWCHKPPKPSPTSKKCRQHILSPTFVPNIDVGLLGCSAAIIQFVQNCINDGILTTSYSIARLSFNISGTQIDSRMSSIFMFTVARAFRPFRKFSWNHFLKSNWETSKPVKVQPICTHLIFPTIRKIGAFFTQW